MSEQENCCECGQIVWASNRVEIEGRVYHGGCLQHKREEDAIGGWCQREIDRDFANDFVDVFGGFPKDDAVKMLVRRLREVRTNAAIAVRQEYMLSLRKRAKMLRESVDPTRATFNVEAVCFILEEEARALGTLMQQGSEQ